MGKGAIIVIEMGEEEKQNWLFYMDNYIQGGSNMTGTDCGLFTHKSSRSYLNHLVHKITLVLMEAKRAPF
jgi:hypothetical protein